MQSSSGALSKRRDAIGVVALHNESVLMSDAKVKANTLNQQYVSIFSKEEGGIPYKCVSPHPVMENLIISQAGVTKLLKGLNMNTPSGPDKIPPKVLNKLAEDVAIHLTSVFITSVEIGWIPH